MSLSGPLKSGVTSLLEEPHTYDASVLRKEAIADFARALDLDLVRDRQPRTPKLRPFTRRTSEESGRSNAEWG